MAGAATDAGRHLPSAGTQRPPQCRAVTRPENIQPQCAEHYKHYSVQNIANITETRVGCSECGYLLHVSTVTSSHHLHHLQSEGSYPISVVGS